MKLRRSLLCVVVMSGHGDVVDYLLKVQRTDVERVAEVGFLLLLRVDIFSIYI